MEISEFPGAWRADAFLTLPTAFTTPPYTPIDLRVSKDVKWVSFSLDTKGRFLIPVVVERSPCRCDRSTGQVHTLRSKTAAYSPLVLVIIASYYVMLFAVLGGSDHALVWELVIAVAFSTVAIIGRLSFPTLVGAGIHCTRSL